MEMPGSSPCDWPVVDPIYFQTSQSYKARKKQVTGQPCSSWPGKGCDRGLKVVDVE